MGQGGLILLVNKTPYDWRRTDQHSAQMPAWDNKFPDAVMPGECVKVYVEWRNDQHDNDSAGEVVYEIPSAGGRRFQVWARGRGRSEEGSSEGLSIYFETLETGQQAKKSLLHLGWEHDGTVGFLLAGNANSFYSSAITSNAKWMSLVDGGRKLTALTIPGTHDTCTYGYSGILENSVVCQNLTLREQLDKGIRFLDIRLKYEESGFALTGNLYLYHGPEPLDRVIDVIVQECYDFLDRNPSETIIMSIKNEAKDDPNESFDKVLNALIQKKADYWYTGVNVPRLEEARKKIVLFRRYALSSATSGGKLGIDASFWPKNMPFTHLNDDGIFFDIQDEFDDYTLFNLSKKYEKYVRDCLDQAKGDGNSDTFFVNFTSGTGGVYPVTLATGLEPVTGTYAGRVGTNNLFSDWLNEHKENVRLGTIPMDFPECPNKGVIPNQLVYRNDFNRYEARLTAGCVYEIHAGQAPGSSLNVFDGQTQSGAPVILFHSTGGKNTQWKLEPHGQNLYTLHPQHAPDKVLAAKDGRTENQTPAVLSDSSNEAHQRWFLEPNRTGFRIKPGHAPSKSLELYGCNTADQTPATLYDVNDTPAQFWLFMMVGFAPNGPYSISPRGDTRSCLERKTTPDGPSYARLELQPWKNSHRNANADQRSILAPVPNEPGWYYIAVPNYSHQVLDVFGGSKENRAETVVGYKNGSDSQKWRIESCGNGYFVLIPKHAQDKVLELYGATTAVGTQPTLYQNNGSVAQQWILKAV